MNNSSVYPYIPNTAPETKKAMMERISAETERDIFDVIPDRLLYDDFDFPEAIPDEYTDRKSVV